jgi:hypothetical protein
MPNVMPLRGANGVSIPCSSRLDYALGDLPFCWAVRRQSEEDTEPATHAFPCLLHPSGQSVRRDAKHELPQPAASVIPREWLMQEGRPSIAVQLLQRTGAEESRPPD